MKTVSPEERISLMYTAIASVLPARQLRGISPSFDTIHSTCVVIDGTLDKIKTDIIQTTTPSFFSHNLQVNTFFFYLKLKYLSYHNLKVLEDTALQGSVAYYTAKIHSAEVHHWCLGNCYDREQTYSNDSHSTPKNKISHDIYSNKQYSL